LKPNQYFPLISSQHFAELWRKHNGNTTAISAETGVSVRNIFLARRRAERDLDTELVAQKTGVQALIRHHKARVNLTIKDAVLPIGGDVHKWPGENTTVQRAFIATVKKLKPRYVILCGDVFDGSRISRHPRIGFLENRPTVRDERKAVAEFLKYVEDAAPRGAMLIWCLGNHDARYESYLAQTAPEMEDVQGMHLKDHFPKWRPCWSVHINEGLEGHTVIKHRWHNGIHAMYNNTLKGGVNVITGHLHKLDSRKWADFRGCRYGVDAGFMADVDDEQFVHYTEDNAKDWTSGFPVLTYRNGRLLRPEFVQKWDEDRVEFRGELIPA